MVDKTTSQNSANQNTTSQPQQNASAQPEAATRGVFPTFDPTSLFDASKWLDPNKVVEAVQQLGGQNWSQAWGNLQNQWTAPYKHVIDEQKRLMEAHLGRTAAMETQWSAGEQKAVEQVQAGVDEMARLTKAGVQYWATLAVQNRANVGEVVKRMSTFGQTAA